MCLGEVGQVLTIDVETVEVLTVAGRRSASVAVLAAEGVELAPGDWVIVSMGFVLERVDHDAAKSLVHDAAFVRGNDRPDLVFTEVFR